MKASILIIGDEVLAGATQDTNSGFIALELRKWGVDIDRILTVSDEVSTIKQALEFCFQTSELVISTGGIGPTKDDKTKSAISQFFRTELVFDSGTYSHLKELFRQRNRLELLEMNRGQAMVFSDAQVLLNRYGTAPGQVISKNGRTAVVLPGVPYEVKPLIKENLPTILKRYGLNTQFYTRTVSVVGIPESKLAQILEDWELRLPANTALSYLPVGNRIKLRLTAKGPVAMELEKQLEYHISMLQTLIGPNIIGKHKDKIEDILKDVILEKSLSLSVAESCTGGLLSGLITSVSGSSSYFKGGVVAYEAAQKSRILNVQEHTIATFTTVSPEVASQMAEGCRHLFNSSVSIATTGVAGPLSDSYNNPIGLAYIAVSTSQGTSVEKVHLSHLDREDFMRFISQRALQFLIQVLQK